MQIPSAYIPTQARELPLATLPVSLPPAEQRQVQAAADTYNKNSTPHIIDAEYVELYPARPEARNQELSNLNVTLAAQTPVNTERIESANRLAEVVKKYRQSEPGAPEAPGSRLNLYA